MLKRGGEVLFIIFILLLSCRTKDPAAEIPTYLYIPAFDIKNEDNKAGMEIFSHKITDVWVFIDGDHQGAYELPAIIPFAESGTHQIEFRPGIKNAGISDGRRSYPYYKIHDITSYNLVPGSIDTLEPITYYEDKRQVFVPWEEGFESPQQPNYIVNPESDTIVTLVDIVNNPDLVFKETRSAQIILEEPGLFFELYSEILTNLPQTDIPIYLEINYKSSHDFVVGFYRNNKTERFPIYIVKGQEDWNKIYLDFSEPIQSSVTGSNFNIFIGFTRKSDVSRVEMYLDNIKLIHF